MSDIHQTEKAFQKQPTIFLAAKTRPGVKVSKGAGRFVRNVGLGIKTPREAYDGHWVDKKCPFTGDVSIRGRILNGTIVSMKMQRTVVIRRDYLHYIKKYQRYEKRHSNLSAHMSPAFLDVSVGDSAVVGQCRPLSKTVRFNVLRTAKKQMKGSKKFRKF
ncbi:40S ribosomal protein S11, variant [Sphaeroforma arctica JP610]|uniref:Small ribosomal subunit protein uS17 n=1 Tax=Sphaeroforma arctica JP610 TaxID=667725 RepID=A0A0L0G5F7_9EUKA|nr:40S ribosomal protein S11, variant [Sphaeroforma arctica JP610]KNC84272.1 40S ribosomal protein S11, variant [Sphaeroforma arctica JP610]|eukprot:XP_014158174.1 40S ribosomal protein S11, variant [Sphaeroforma arctica JP610]